jgi:hypothetical protein
MSIVEPGSRQFIPPKFGQPESAPMPCIYRWLAKMVGYIYHPLSVNRKIALIIKTGKWFPGNEQNLLSKAYNNDIQNVIYWICRRFAVSEKASIRIMILNDRHIAISISYASKNELNWPSYENSGIQYVSDQTMQLLSFLISCGNSLTSLMRAFAHAFFEPLCWGYGSLVRLIVVNSASR